MPWCAGSLPHDAAQRRCSGRSRSAARRRTRRAPGSPPLLSRRGFTRVSEPQACSSTRHASGRRSWPTLPAWGMPRPAPRANP